MTVFCELHVRGLVEVRQVGWLMAVLEKEERWECIESCYVVPS